jgi:hypothetical protein
MNTYNTSYYATHKDRIKTRARYRERKKRAEAVAFRSVQHPTEPKLYFKATLLFALVACITYLLLAEMSAFYAEAEGSILLGWMKAIALEGSVIAFSVIKPQDFLRRVLYPILSIAICALSLYALCSKQVGIGLGSIETKQINSRAIVDAENAIQAKLAQHDLLLHNGWITSARKTDVAIDSLRAELKALRVEATKMKSTTAATHSMWVQILMRVALMVSNLVFSKRLFEILGNFKPRMGTSAIPGILGNSMQEPMLRDRDDLRFVV